MLLLVAVEQILALSTSVLDPLFFNASKSRTLMTAFEGHGLQLSRLSLYRLASCLFSMKNRLVQLCVVTCATFCHGICDISSG